MKTLKERCTQIDSILKAAGYSTSVRLLDDFKENCVIDFELSNVVGRIKRESPYEEETDKKIEAMISGKGSVYVKQRMSEEGNVIHLEGELPINMFPSENPKKCDITFSNRIFSGAGILSIDQLHEHIQPKYSTTHIHYLMYGAINESDLDRWNTVVNDFDGLIRSVKRCQEVFMKDSE